MTTVIPYENYRDSMDRWLGELPGHWATPALGQVVRIRNGSDYKQIETDDAASYPVIGSGGPFARATEYLYDRPTVLLGRKGTIDRPLYWDGPFWAVDTMFYTEISDQVEPRFLYYFSMRIDFKFYSTNTALPSMASSDLRAIRFALPPLDEQRQIAEYLDRETGKIDELIAKQEQLVATLTERVTALWANRIDLLTAHYPTVSIRRVISSIVDGPFGSSLTSAHYSDEGARVIRLGNIGIFTFKDVDVAYVPLEYALELSAHAVLAGDVVVAGLGDDKMPLGRAAVVPETLGIALVKADCYRIRPNGQVSPEYMAWALSSPQLREQFKVLSRGSTRQRLNTAVVREATIPLPPRVEQDHAVEQFTRESEQTGQLVLKATKVVEMLRERRAALISAAVTGKIDVRGL